MTTQKRENDARADAAAASVLRRDAFSSSQEDPRDLRLHSGASHGANSLQRASSASSLFTKTAGMSFSRSVSSRIPRFALGLQKESESAPGSPQVLSFTSAEPPSSIASTTESVSSNRAFGIRAVDNGTPSRLAQFRAKSWLRDAGKKRALETGDGAAHPPKRRAVTSLFSDEPRRVPVPAESSGDGGGGAAADDAGDFGDGDAQQDQFPDTLSVVSCGMWSTSQSSSSTDSYDDTRLRLQQEIKVGRCLEQDLTRDSARMKLKMDSLRDDIDYYYELLAKIEAVALNARSRASGSDGANASENASVTSLAEAVQRIISAPKADRNAVIGVEK